MDDFLINFIKQEIEKDFERDYNEYADSLIQNKKEGQKNG